MMDEVIVESHEVYENEVQPIEIASKEQKIKSEAELQPQKHPAGKFMWSAALGDPFITWFFHRKALKNAPRNFFWIMTKFYLIMFIPDFILGCLMDYHEKESSVMIYLVLLVVYSIVNIVIQGFVGAKVIRFSYPNYESTEYQNNERCAVWFSLSSFVAAALANFHSATDISLPLTVFDIPYLFESLFWKFI